MVSGNFAVVRRCVHKRTRQAFALKIIDKSKCQGKEHMIESEIAILNLVSHAHIIELIEVFDFLDEKYLVTELVPGGDLFDAIAVDTKYSESVSRRMICDLTSALQYLHDTFLTTIKHLNAETFHKQINFYQLYLRSAGKIE